MPANTERQREFSWTDPRFTYADLLTGSRLVMLPYLIYALASRLPGLAVATFSVMITSDVIDGKIARRMGQSRHFGGAFDSTVDFVLLYTLFTAFAAIGMLAWWRWAVIFIPGLFMAATQLLYVVKAQDVMLAPALAGKVVGQIQYVYLPFLLIRTFWLNAPWAQTADTALFWVLAAAIVVNTVDYARTLNNLLRLVRRAGAG